MTISIRALENQAASARVALSAWDRPLPVACADWADANFYMSAESSYAEGVWQTLPYQRAPLNMMGNDAIKELDILKSARVGYSKMLMACAAYMAAHKKRNQIVYQPTDSAAQDFMKNHVQPMIRDVDAVRALASWFGKKHPNNTQQSKTFDNRRQLWLLGGASAKNYREKSVDTVYIDELDGFDEDVEGEGRPDLLAKKRNEGSYFGKMICGSTPTVKHRSLIYRRAQTAECLLSCHIPCPDCGEYQALVFDNLKLIDREDYSSVRYACIHCGSLWTQSQAYQQQRECIWRGEAIQTRDGLTFEDMDGNEVETPRHVAVHIWSAYSPMTTWADIMRDFFSRKDNPTELQTWWNQTLGRVWEKAGDVPPWKPLYERSRHAGYEPNQPAEWVSLITAGVDVQRNRLEVEIVGWGEGKRSQSIDYRVLMGDTSDLSGEAWQALRALIAEQWPHPSGAKLPLSCMAVDSGDQTQTVYTFCREYQQPQVIAIKGSDNAASIVGIPKPVDVTDRGRKVRRGVMVWSVGSSLLKQELFSLLKLDQPIDSDLPPGWCEWPQYGPEYFQGLCSEQLVRVKNRAGYTRHQWEKIRERNEPLDCRCYARAAASVVGLDRWTAEDWQARRESLGVERAQRKDTDEKNGVEFRRSRFGDWGRSQKEETSASKRKSDFW